MRSAYLAVICVTCEGGALGSGEAMVEMGFPMGGTPQVTIEVALLK